MAMLVGKRYVTPEGVELLVTKGGDGTFTDGDVELLERDKGPYTRVPQRDGEPRTLQLGKRFGIFRTDKVRQTDGTEKDVITTFQEALIIKPGVGDLRYNGEAMEIIAPQVLPSAD